jgi:hypothetical protein
MRPSKPAVRRIGSRSILPVAAALAAVSLAACNNTHGSGMASGGDSRLCIPFATTTTTTTTTTTNGQASAPVVAAPIASDPGVAVEDCLHRWGYALAASADDANQVATATVAACGSSISRWNQQTLTGGDGGGPPEAPSLLTGQPTTPIAEHFIFAQGRALFYVVQARAGKCAAPPIANGVPVGVVAD